jgi:hypothetical protein
MLPIRSLALLLTLLSLVACEQSSNPPEQSKAEAAKAQTAVTSKAKAESAPAVNKPSAAESQPATQPKPKQPDAEREPEPAEAKAPLDLSLHPNVFDPLQPLEPLSDLSTPLLPPMFVEKSEPDSPFQLNGSLITNERGDDYWQSVEGAQLQFEFKQ